MRRFLFPVLLILSALLGILPGCEPKEDLLTTDSSAKLAFSADTVLFDTVFAQVGTVSKRLWVYNRNNRAVKIEQIRLADTNPGTYSLIINGDEKQAAAGLELRGKDSLLILVKAKLGPSSTVNKPYLVTDELLFRTNGNDQDVKLVAYGQNAYFHTLERLPCNTTWRNDKPHVIYGAAVVNAGCTLTIEPGTRVYSHAGAVLLVEGSLRVNANANPAAELKPDDRTILVRFQGDRLEPFYNEVPGQWGGIQFAASSRNNLVRFTEIKNASYGLLINNPLNQTHPDVTVENTLIRNISGAGLDFGGRGSGAGVFGICGDFSLTNCLISNCGEYAVVGFGGGTFNLNFCTVANYTVPQRETASLSFTDVAVTTRPLAQPIQTRINIQNSIVWGSIKEGNELFFQNASRYQSLVVRNSIVRTALYAGTSDATDKPGLAKAGLNNLVNVTPKFRRSPDNGFGTPYDFRLDTLSPASNSRTAVAPVPARDVLNKQRNTNTPDLGAYERVNP